MVSDEWRDIRLSAHDININYSSMIVGVWTNKKTKQQQQQQNKNKNKNKKQTKKLNLNFGVKASRSSTITKF